MISVNIDYFCIQLIHTMKIWRYILSAALLLSLSFTLSAQGKDPLRYWNDVLDRYEMLCNACIEHHSQKEVKSLTSALQEILKSPVGKMNDAQQKRFTDIQKRYRGISSEVPQAVSPTVHIVQIDTVRKIEHVTVVDTVFVKEILGEVAILQQMSRRDTVVHILTQPEPDVKAPVHDTIYIERIPDKGKDRTPLLLLAEAGVAPELSYGAMLAYGDRFGAYIKARDSFRHRKGEYTYMDGDIVWTTGLTDYSRTSITAGGFMSVLPWMKVYTGAGYGIHRLLWEDSDGRWMEVSDASSKGPALNVGIICTCRSLALSIGVDTIIPGHTDLELGIGICF